MDGQAETAPDELSLVNDIFSDAEPTEEAPQDGQAAEDETPAVEAEAEEESQEETEEEAEPTPERKIKVAIKDDNGQESTLEIDESELVKGYHRQADYTRKTQALAEREQQAAQVFHQEYSKARDSYLQKAEFATQAIARMAGFRSDAEMQQLAATDPASWVQENQRQQQIRQILGTLEQQTQAERQQAEMQAKEQHEQNIKRIRENSWNELQKDGIDRPKLVKIYEGVMNSYGYKHEDLSNVTDYRLVRMMSDAMAYRDLKSKASTVTQKAKDASKLPSKQTKPTDSKGRDFETKFRSGKAKLTDFVDYFDKNL